MVRLCMMFGRQSLTCRVPQETTAELVAMFAPDAYTIEGADE